MKTFISPLFSLHKSTFNRYLLFETHCFSFSFSLSTLDARRGAVMKLSVHLLFVFYFLFFLFVSVLSFSCSSLSSLLKVSLSALNISWVSTTLHISRVLFHNRRYKGEKEWKKSQGRKKNKSYKRCERKKIVKKSQKKKPNKKKSKKVKEVVLCGTQGFEDIFLNPRNLSHSSVLSYFSLIIFFVVLILSHLFSPDLRHLSLFSHFIAAVSMCVTS